MSQNTLVDNLFDKIKKIVFYGGILYIMSPVDPLPELFLGPIGLIDDFVIAILVFIIGMSESDIGLLRNIMKK